MADVHDTGHTVFNPDHKIGPARSYHGCGRVNLEGRARSVEDLGHQGPEPSLGEFYDHATQVPIRVVDVLGNLDMALLSDRQDAVVVKEGFRPRLSTGVDHIFEQDLVM